jgi:hypothetical protein
MSTRPFILGVNYPWARYAEDFGRTAEGHRGVSSSEVSSSVIENFARIRDCGASVVRWFLFADGRGGFLSERGIPTGPDELLFRDVEAALVLAERHGLRVCFSLVDYLWLQDRLGSSSAHAHSHVFQFAAGRAAFLHRVLIPMFREFKEHPGLFAWEIANEPEWAIREFHPKPMARMHFADFRVFATELTAAAHEFGKAQVTLGCARLPWVRAWNGIGLDFYQAHFYPSMETGSSLSKQIRGIAHLDKPLWLGELPARDPNAPSYSVEESLSLCHEAGLHGAAIWRWTTPESTGTDVAIGCVDPAALSGWHFAPRGRKTVV